MQSQEFTKFTAHRNLCGSPPGIRVPGLCYVNWSSIKKDKINQYECKFYLPQDEC